MTNLTLGALLLASALQTDTTFAAGNATQLDVEAAGGSIVVRTWTRPEIRIEAEHSSRTSVRVRRRGTSIDVEPETNRGLTTIVDFVITVPESMNLDLEGMWTRIDVEGARGQVLAETMQSDIRIDGGRGRVKAASVNGLIHVANAEGRIEIESTARSVTVDGSRGELMVEAVGGSVTVNRSTFRMAEVTSVGGRIIWNGGVEPGGSYFFGTHGGPIAISVPEGRGARITVATIQGEVSSDLAGSPGQFPRGQRTTFETGDGSAEVEIETFAGRIVLTHREVLAQGSGRDSGADPSVHVEHAPGPRGPTSGFGYEYGFAFDQVFDQVFDHAFEYGFDHGFDQLFNHGFGYGFDRGLDNSFDISFDNSFDTTIDNSFDTTIDNSFDHSFDLGFETGSDDGGAHGFDFASTTSSDDGGGRALEARGNASTSSNFGFAFQTATAAGASGRLLARHVSSLVESALLDVSKGRRER